MTSFVIDASVAIKWVAPEADSAQALRLHDHSLAAPNLLLLVRAENTQNIQEAHIVLGHILCAIIERELAAAS